MKRILICLLLFYTATACQKGQIDGLPSYGSIYIYSGGALIEAHNCVLNCPKEASTISIDVVSYRGLTRAAFISGEKFASVTEKPSFPPDTGELYDITDSQYIQRVSVFLDTNISNQDGRDAILQVESPAFNGCIAEIVIHQKGW